MRKRKFKAPSGAGLSFTELGFGSAPLGNLYQAVSNADAEATLEAAWAAGIRYFDTAPLYGLGLSETRLNHFLHGRRRSDYVISTKVGRKLHRCAPAKRTGIGKFYDTPSRVEEFDYSYDGIMRSLEDSLERLGHDHVDILLVHDIDVFTHKSEAARDVHFRTLMKSGYRALRKLRDEKVIKVFGAGINEWQIAEKLVRAGDFDLFLLASRYTLLEQGPIESFLPLCEERGIGIVVGGPYNSGILATGPVRGAHYDYERAPKHILQKVRRIEAVCKKHNVRLPEAALRFPLHHPCVVSVIPGANSPAQVQLNIKTLAADIPETLWQDLVAQELVDRKSILPGI